MNRKGTPLPVWMLAANEQTRLAAEQALRARRPTRTVHVWVAGTDADHPGLVIEWRRTRNGWQALTAYLESDGQLAVQWLDARRVTPLQVTSPPGKGSPQPP